MFLTVTISAFFAGLIFAAIYDIMMMKRNRKSKCNHDVARVGEGGKHFCIFCEEEVNGYEYRY
jgi:hypothetical protein